MLIYHKYKPSYYIACSKEAESDKIIKKSRIGNLRHGDILKYFDFITRNVVPYIAHIAD